MADIDFYTPKEAADKLRISMTTLYKYLHQKKKLIPVRRFGRNCIRFPKAEFDKWAGLTNEGTK